MGETLYTIVLDIEEAFSPAFTNGLDGRPAHMDSYMTVMSYDIVEKIFAEIHSKYSDEVWQQVIDYWLGLETFLPMSKLLAKEIQRELKQEF